MKFYYEAFTTRGEPKVGEIEAPSEEAAAGKIRNELGLIAREIKPHQFEPKLAHNRAVARTEAKPFDPQNIPLEQPSLRMPPPPMKKILVIPPETIPPETEPKLEPKVPLRPFAELAEDLTRISDVARQMETWKARYGEKTEEGDPMIGGATWKIYEEDKKKIISDLIRSALTRAVMYPDH